MLNHVPELVEPYGLAEVGRSFRGAVAIAKLKRLSPFLVVPDGELQVQLEFAIDEYRLRVLRGFITGQLSLVCQRCLQAVKFPINLKFQLGIIASDSEIDRLPQGYEPLLVSGDPMETRDIIEDELLLAIPAAPAHTDKEGCTTGYQNQPVKIKRENPFTVLDKLKH